MCSENQQQNNHCNNIKTEEFKSLTLENALEQLETIVAQMENENLPLEEMIKNYEKGSKLASFCESKLKEFEKRIEVLVKENRTGGEWKQINVQTENQNNKEK